MGTTASGNSDKGLFVFKIQIKDNQVIYSRYEAQVKSWMVQIGGFNYESLWNMDSKLLSNFRRWMIHPKRKLLEFQVSDNAVIPSGVELNAAHFVAGQFVDCQGITKGKGFQGVMKRHGFKACFCFTVGSTSIARKFTFSSSHGIDGNEHHSWTCLQGQKDARKNGW